MSQRSRRNRKSGASQASNSSQMQNISQLTKPSQKGLAPNELVQKCVRFFLIKMVTNVPIKRAQLVQAIFKERPGRMFDFVLEGASEILKEIYGLNIKVIDGDTANKKYIVTNELKNSDLVCNSEEENFKTVIRFLVLTHIFMSKNSATETSIWEFLKTANIHPEKKLSDVGDTYRFVLKQLIKEQFVQYETGLNDEGESCKKYMWAVRAEECVSKMEILKFVAKMYGNANVKHWWSRYENALNQPSFAQPVNDEAMLIDE